MANIVIPPWLEPQPIPQLYAQGMNTGVAAAAQQNEARRAAAALQQQAAIQSAAMQQEAAIQAARISLERDIAAQRSAQAAVDAQIERERNAAMLALREQDMLRDQAYRASRLEDYDQSLKLREQTLQRQQEQPSLTPYMLPNGKQVLLTKNGAVFDPNKPAQPPYADRMQIEMVKDALSKLRGDPFADPAKVQEMQDEFNALLGGGYLPTPVAPPRQLKVIQVR